MDEKHLSEALLRGEDPLDIAALTNRVLRRDRRRVWLLTALCLMAWAVVSVPIAIVLPGINQLKAASEYQKIRATRGPETREVARGIDNDHEIAMGVLRLSTLALGACAATITLAAIATVFLIIASRRATLRQVNARLAEISAQLMKLAGKPQN